MSIASRSLARYVLSLLLLLFNLFYCLTSALMTPPEQVLVPIAASAFLVWKSEGQTCWCCAAAFRPCIQRLSPPRKLQYLLVHQLPHQWGLRLRNRRSQTSQVEPSFLDAEPKIEKLNKIHPITITSDGNHLSMVLMFCVKRYTKNKLTAWFLQVQMKRIN